MALAITSRRSFEMVCNRISMRGCTEDEAVAAVVLQRVRSRIRQVAHAQVALALKLGTLVRPAVCSCCGRRPTRGRKNNAGLHAHHPDYSEPLLIVWLCRTCHGAEHARLRRAGKVSP